MTGASASAGRGVEGSIRFEFDADGNVVGGIEHVTEALAGAILSHEVTGVCPEVTVVHSDKGVLQTKLDDLGRTNNRKRLGISRQIQRVSELEDQIARGTRILIEERERILTSDPDELAESVSEFIRRCFGNVEVPGHRLSLDLFLESPLTISVRISLNEEEMRDTLGSDPFEMLQIPRRCIHLPILLFKFRAVPAMVWEIVRTNADQRKDIRTDSLYHFGAWKFGLA